MNEQLRKWLKDFRDKLIDGQIVKESDGDPWGYTKSEGDQIQAYLEANLPIALANPMSDKLRTLLGELYQVLGVLGAPANVLDQVSAGTAGKPLPHDTLLPFAAPDSAPPETREQKATRLVRESGKTVHSNTCATSIAPAEEPGPCDCDSAPGQEALDAIKEAIHSYLGSDSMSDCWGEVEPMIQQYVLRSRREKGTM